LINLFSIFKKIEQNGIKAKLYMVAKIKNHSKYRLLNKKVAKIFKKF